MRILLTNNRLDVPAGSELVLRDIAMELVRRGHQPVAYSTTLGETAKELRAATIPVIDRIECLSAPPDIIHGQHHYETMIALLRFPQTPAIYFCHGWAPWQEAPLWAPQIRRHVAVDDLCRERLIAEGGIPIERIAVLRNWFDQRRFPPRPPLPERPRTALAFGHFFRESADLPLLREACASRGIQLDSVGQGAGRIETNPGALLGRYDLVFAKARAALEAMAVGAAVILCNDGKLGPMVTSRNFDQLRPLNFGVRTLDRKLDLESVRAELDSYDAQDAAAVCRMVREQCELQPAVDRLVELYSRVIEEAAADPQPTAATTACAGAQYLERWAPQYKLGPEYGGERAGLVERCLAAESAATQLIARSQAAETARIEAERCRLDAERCRSIAEEAARRLETEKQAVANRLEQSEQALAAIRASATWRWTQQALRNPLVGSVFGPWIRRVATSSAPPAGAVQARAEIMIARHGFLGVPKETFEQAGRSQMGALLNEGLRPDSRVLDIGCGCLRIGCWLIRYLQPGHYYGIEPARERVEHGIKYLLDPGEVKRKRPHFNYNADFDTSVFGGRFDFFLARSIWTHAPKSQIQAMLDGFLRNGARNAIFLASYLPAASEEEDYNGERWVGTSHESATPGVIRHSLAWIVQQCELRGLQVTELSGKDCDDQLWLRIQRAR